MHSRILAGLFIMQLACTPREEAGGSSAPPPPDPRTSSGVASATTTSCGSSGPCTSSSHASTTAYSTAFTATASAGGTLEITEQQDRGLAGFSLSIPPGALSSDVRITVASGASLVLDGELALGPAVQLGPSGLRFDAPATLGLPFDPAHLGDPRALRVRVVEDSGLVSLLWPEDVTVKSPQRRLEFPVWGFSSFQAVQANCQGAGCYGSACQPESDNCQGVLSCRGGICQCASGATFCNGEVCVDLSRHDAHCGACNRAVQANQHCCGGQPFMFNDPHHCGRNCTDCGVDATCVLGTCVATTECTPACQPDAECVSGTCTPINCSTSTTPCPAPTVCNPDTERCEQIICTPSNCVSSGCWQRSCDPNRGCVATRTPGCCESDQECPAPQICTSNRCTCTPTCTPGACGGQDGCGGTCGCPAPAVCRAGACCTPQCSGKECGADGCGGQCPSRCSGSSVCFQDRCCTPDCAYKFCGPDGCGGTCPTIGCPFGGTCNTTTGQCCTPDCTGKECGEDGCGGSCQPCTGGMICRDFHCACAVTCADAPCKNGECLDGFGCTFTCSCDACHAGPLCEENVACR